MVVTAVLLSAQIKPRLEQCEDWGVRLLHAPWLVSEHDFHHAVESSMNHINLVLRDQYPCKVFHFLHSGGHLFFGVSPRCTLEQNVHLRAWLGTLMHYSHVVQRLDVVFLGPFIRAWLDELLALPFIQEFAYLREKQTVIDTMISFKLRTAIVLMRIG